MERLKKIIEQYGRWSELTIYTERIEAHTSADFSHAISNSLKIRATNTSAPLPLPLTAKKPWEYLDEKNPGQSDYCISDT